jgi:predicted dehydrogenase
MRIDAGAIGDPHYALIELWRNFYRPGAEGWRYDPRRAGDWILEKGRRGLRACRGSGGDGRCRIRTGGPPPVTREDGRRAVAMCLKAQESVRSGGVVPL